MLHLLLLCLLDSTEHTVAVDATSTRLLLFCGGRPSISLLLPLHSCRTAQLQRLGYCAADQPKPCTATAESMAPAASPAAWTDSYTPSGESARPADDPM
jgi:hypothetical protein